MSRDLVQQLAEYGEQFADVQRAVTLDEVVRDRTSLRVEVVEDPLRVVDGKEITMIDTPSTTARPSGSNRSRWILGAAAAGVLTIGVVGVVALRADDDELTDQLASTSTDLPSTVSPSPTVEPTTTTADSTAATVASTPTTSMSVVPADAVGESVDGEARATGETPLPDFDTAELADSGEPPRVLNSIDELPNSARLDFLWQVCDDGSCFRDANFRDAGGAVLGSASGADEPFHIRHGFVNDGPDELGDGFDLAVYAFRMDVGGGTSAASGPTGRYTTDSVVRGETDACGPNHESQTGTVTCQWFVHDFPNGLPEGHWALWAVWEAPCSAWIGLGRTDSCADPDEVLSFFSSGVDSPFEPGLIADGEEPTVTEAGDWTRVDGLDAFGVVSDGTAFFSSDGGSIFRSDDGVTWEVYAEVDEATMQFEELFDPYGPQYNNGTTTVALRDGRFVAVEDLRGNSVIVHIVDSDGEHSTQVVPVEIPAAYEPFHRELRPSVHLVDDGRIVIAASYSADAGLVEATGRTRADLGLDLFYPSPRPIIVVSGDAETWTQLELPALGIEAVTSVSGGLVAVVGPVLAGPFQVSSSVDGTEWEPVIDPESGQPPDGHPIGGPGTGGRAFVVRQPGFESFEDDGRIWEVTIDGARLIAGGGAASEPLELFQRFHHGRLSAGDAGIAFLSVVDEEMTAPLPDGEGIRFSSDGGATWGFEPFPDGVTSPGHLSVGESTMVVVSHGRNGSTTLWVWDVPD